MNPDDTPSAPLHRAFDAPAQVVATVARMLLGLGLAVALVLKVYMALFTNHVCAADAVTLGNLIRCTPTLTIVGGTLMMVAGIGVAVALFSDAPHQLGRPLLIALVAVVLHILAGIAAGALGWETALVLAALLALLAAVFVSLRLTQGPVRAAPPRGTGEKQT